MKILIDTNVILDVLQNRDPWCVTGKQVFLAVATNEITGCLTAKQLTDIHYFSRKQFKEQENVDEKCRSVIAKLISLFEIIDTLSVDCQEALAVSNHDYEDAVLIASAVRSGIDCIVTRDKQHFGTAPIPIYEPEEFLNVINPETGLKD